MRNKETDRTREALQQFYLACRDLVSGGIVPPVSVQRSFESVLSGIMADDHWRSTHISPSALTEIAEGRKSNVQRAHGVVGDRMDRFARTISVLTGPEKTIDEWWPFWQSHDTTVLITKEEHGSGRRFSYEELIPLPTGRGLFVNSGFSFKVRKGHEMKWIEEIRGAQHEKSG